MIKVELSFKSEQDLLDYFAPLAERKDNLEKTTISRLAKPATDGQALSCLAQIF